MTINCEFSLLCFALLTVTSIKDMGYTVDFVASMKPLLKQVKEKGIKVITNAGGVNPEACAKQLAAIAADQGVDLSIALIEGDNLMGNVSEKKLCVCERQREREWNRERKASTLLVYPFSMKR